MPRANRIITGADYRRVSRRGRRSAGRFTVISVAAATTDDARFGFIVTRKLGGAVVRNRVRRRLKAIARSLVDQGMPPADIVVRALPSSVTADWTSLQDEVSAVALGRSR
nr:ribonuclease P protein component [Herbiconiux sp. L3-i23]